MSRELDLYGDDVARWCPSCGEPLEDDEQTLCDDCERDEDEHENSRTKARAEHCREEAQNDLFKWIQWVK
jgi:NMD protein affecting ribosome stability and mRNA decay